MRLAKIVAWMFALGIFLVAVALFAYHAARDTGPQKPHSVTLNWKTSAGADSYNVYRGDADGGPFNRIATTKTTSYVDTAVSSDENYYYVVTALKNGKESGFSNQAKAVVP